MKTKLSQKDVTPALKSSVNAYLIARAFAETMREKVNEVYKESLSIHPLFEDFMSERRNGANKRILDVDKMYLSTDEATCKEVYADVNYVLKEKGIKPDDMPDDHCPALVAEELQRKTEKLIIDSAGEMLGFDFDGKELSHRLLCLGLEKYRQFIDLCVGLVVNLPDFKSPLAK